MLNLKILLLTILIIAHGILSATPNDTALSVGSDTAWVQYGPNWTPRAFILTPSHDTTDWAVCYEYQYDGSAQPVLFFGVGDTLEFNYSDDPISVHFRHSDKGAVIRFYYMSEEMPANYSEDYRKNNGGRVQCDIPEVFELANIAIAITDYGLTNPNRVMRSGDYYKEVIEHFRRFKDHPLIRAIEFSDDKIGDYYSFRDNALRYEFAGDSIVPVGIYLYVRIPDLFSRYLGLLQDFAKKSEFRKFYGQHIDFYRSQEKALRQRTDVRKAWSWLEKRFPERYDSYRIVFSPLIRASHETARYRDRQNGFSETIMFVGGPDLWADTYHGAVQDAMLTRMVFTEIDHNYVNPATRQYRSEIARAFWPAGHWQLNTGYNSPSAFFDEYMTWALFILYARSAYSPDDFAEIRSDTERMMTQRGFPRFQEFAQHLTDICPDKPELTDIPALYPKIISWADSLSGN